MLRMGPSRYQARVLRVLESNTTRAYEEALLSVAERDENQSSAER